MGDVVPFRGKRKWTRPEDYGHVPDEPAGHGGAGQGGGGAGGGGSGGGGRKPPSRRGRSGWRSYSALGFWGAVVTGLSLWVASDPVLVEPPQWLAGDAETVSGRFTRCGEGPGRLCVVDGDTFHIGKRRIRIVGIDAPELHPARCPAEAKAGEAATRQLIDLLNAGSFFMTARIDAPVDQYGRELRALSRVDAKGRQVSLAEAMIASGTVRRYLREGRQGWC